MKAIDKLNKFFTSIADFWSNFWIGFFEEERTYNKAAEPWNSYSLPADLLYRSELDYFSIHDCIGHPLSAFLTEQPKKTRLGKYGYPIPEQPKPAPQEKIRKPSKTKKVSSKKPSKPQTSDPDTPKQVANPIMPQKVHRPNQTFTYELAVTIDIPFPVPTRETLNFTLLKQPFKDRNKNELFYSYNLYINGRPCRPWIGRDHMLVCFENFNDRWTSFLLCSFTETVEYSNGSGQFIMNYSIRDGKHKRRKFRATKAEQDGVTEALEFFYALQYYETWEEYDELHDLCPNLGMKARDLRDQLRRDLCEVGMKLA